MEKIHAVIRHSILFDINPLYKMTMVIKSKTNKNGHAKNNPDIDKGRCSKRIRILWENNATVADVNKPNARQLSNKNVYDRRHLSNLRLWVRNDRKGRDQGCQAFLGSKMEI